MKLPLSLGFIRDTFTRHHLNNYNSTDYNRPRIEYIDLVKGVCIILVILLHFDFTTFNFPNSAALRMPLYFFLSGMFFKTYGGLGPFWIKKLNNLAIPFLFWLLISFAIIFVEQKLKYHYWFGIENLFLWINTHEIDINGSLWFLMCLFVCNLIFFTLQKYLKGYWLTTDILAMAVVGNLMREASIMLPFWIDSACTALPFFYLGYTLKDSRLLKETKGGIKEFIIGALLISMAYLIYFLCDDAHFTLRLNTVIGNPLFAYINSIFYVLGLVLICKVIKWLPIVSYFGRFSIIILCSHYLIMILIGNFYTLVFSDNPSVMVRALLFFPLCWLSIPLCNAIIPHFTAQKPLIKAPSLKVG